MIITSDAAYNKALGILSMFLEFKKNILQQLTKKIVAVDNILDIFNKLDDINKEITNLPTWDEWVDSYPNRDNTALEFQLIRFISLSKIKTIRVTLTGMTQELLSVNRDLNNTTIDGVGFSPDSLAKLDYAWWKYRTTCIVATAGYQPLQDKDAKPFELELDRSHTTVEKLITLYAHTWYARLRATLASFFMSEPSSIIRSPPLTPPTPPTHEHTIEDVRKGFFPENVNMRTILQVLLGIHDELKGIRIALETK